MLSALDQAVVVVDGPGAVAIVNPAAGELLGLPEGEVPLHAASAALEALQARAVNIRDAEVIRDALAADTSRVISGVTWEFAEPQTLFLRVASHPLGDAHITGRTWVLDDVTPETNALREAELAQHQFRLLAENASDVVLRLDNDGVVEWASPSVADLTGLPASRMRGRRIGDFLHPDDLRTVRAAERVLANGEPAMYEVRVRTPSGDYRWGSVHARPVLDDNGRVVGRIGGWRDMQSLRDQWSVVSHALDGIPGMGIAIFDRELRYQLVRGGRLAFAVADTAWEGQLVRDVVPPDQWDAVRALYSSTLDGERREFQVEGVDGASTFLVRSLPLPGTSGDIIGGVVLVTDITARVRVEAEIRERNDRLVEMDHLKDRMIATVSHELRTPTTSLSLLLEVLAGESGLPDRVHHLVGAGLRSAGRLRRLVEDLLLLAQADNDGLAITLAPVMPADIARDVLGELERVASRGGVSLRGEIADVHPVVGDQERIAQVMLNLVGNAIKFTPEGGAVLLGVAPCEQGWRLHVRDTGIGIPPEELPHLFDPFYRASTATDSVIGGTGLGLAVVQHIVDAHGGEIRVTSTVGQGTGIEVVFPRDPGRGAGSLSEAGAEREREGG